MVYMDGTIHSLSTTTGSGIPWTLTVVSNPPSSGARLWYNGYPSLSDCVSWRSSLGNLFPHFPFLMQGALLFITPHGPWTMDHMTFHNSVQKRILFWVGQFSTNDWVNLGGSKFFSEPKKAMYVWKTTFLAILWYTCRQQETHTR